MFLETSFLSEKAYKVFIIIFFFSLPGPESLFEPGKREGQTKMVRHGEIVSCYRYKNCVYFIKE